MDQQDIDDDRAYNKALNECIESSIVEEYEDVNERNFRDGFFAALTYARATPAPLEVKGGEVEIIKKFYADVCKLAESKMLKTGKLEGAHYAAMKELIERLDNQRIGNAQ